MKVNKLINVLKKCNPNKEVMFSLGRDNLNIDYCYEDKHIELGQNTLGKELEVKKEHKPYTDINNIVNDMLSVGGKK